MKGKSCKHGGVGSSCSGWEFVCVGSGTGPCPGQGRDRSATVKLFYLSKNSCVLRQGVPHTKAWAPRVCLNKTSHCEGSGSSERLPCTLPGGTWFLGPAGRDLQTTPGSQWLAEERGAKRKISLSVSPGVWEVEKTIISNTGEV